METWRTREWLNDHYNNKGMSWVDIGRLVGRTANAVRFAAKSFGIKSRTISEVRLSIHHNITKELLEKLYEDECLSIPAIAIKLSVSPSVIQNRLKRYGIDARSASNSQIVRNNNKGKIPRLIWATKEWLKKAYVGNKMSISDITTITGWSHCRTIEIMDELGIQRRNGSDAVQLKSSVISARVKNDWQRIEFQNKMMRAFANRPKVSFIQEALYNILDDLDVKFFREHNDKPDDLECSIGGRLFDCVIPRVGKPTLLIECQGSYYHTKRDSQRKDKEKYDHIEKIFPGQYEIKQLWEHEFGCENRIYDQLKHWLDLEETIDFDFAAIQVRQLPRPDAKRFFSAYHYLGGIGNRGAILYGAYLNDKLVAAIVFSSLVRQNIPTGTLNPNEVREISRLCIHPQYHKRNFASWFVSKTIKLLPKEFRAVIAYADSTHNHVGIVYQACNFKCDRVTETDYWYCDENGNKIHKKTLYNQARSAKMIESEFATKFGYTKVFGSHKYRYTLQR